MTTQKTKCGLSGNVKENSWETDFMKLNQEEYVAAIKECEVDPLGKDW